MQLTLFSETLRKHSTRFDKLALNCKFFNLDYIPDSTEPYAIISDRTATIQIGGYIGPSFHMNSGIPQGASISPTLHGFILTIPEPLLGYLEWFRSS